MSVCTYMRDFPQAKLDSRINACFLVNKHCDLDLFAWQNAKIMYKLSSFSYEIRNNHVLKD